MTRDRQRLLFAALAAALVTAFTHWLVSRDPELGLLRNHSDYVERFRGLEYTAGGGTP